MTESIAVIIGASVGSGITGLFAIFSIHLQRRADERRQIRELAVRVAIENWKHSFEIAKARGAATSVSVSPLDTYLVHAMNLVKALDGRIRTPEQVAVLLKEGYALTGAVSEEVKTHTEKIKKRQNQP